MPARALPFLLLLLLLPACLPPPPDQPADADPAEIRRRLDYLSNRLAKLERAIERSEKTAEELDRTIRQSKADQSVMIEGTRVDLRTLQGNLDVVRHDLTESTEANRKIREDLDGRVTELENRMAGLAAAPPPPQAPAAGARRPAAAPPSRAGVDDITRYNQILRVVLDRKDYDAAIGQFEEFLKEYPQSSLRANAQYWIGEGHFAKGDYRKSIAEFQKVVDHYPKSEKVCDSVLKQGFSFAEMKETDNARLFLGEVAKRCPRTKAAAQAQERLKELAAAPAKK